MILKDVTAGEVIIKEGADGDVMYIIDRGEFTVHKKDESGVSQLIFTYTSPGAAFGELSLMYGKPRAASVKAKTNGRLWSIGRQVSCSIHVIYDIRYVMSYNPINLLRMYVIV